MGSLLSFLNEVAFSLAIATLSSLPSLRAFFQDEEEVLIVGGESLRQQGSRLREEPLAVYDGIQGPRRVVVVDDIGRAIRPHRATRLDCGDLLVDMIVDRLEAALLNFASLEVLATLDASHDGTTSVHLALKVPRNGSDASTSAMLGLGVGVDQRLFSVGDQLPGIAAHGVVVDDPAHREVGLPIRLGEKR